MIYKAEEAFAKAYKAGERFCVYFLHGSENYLIERWTNQILNEAGGNAFNLHKFDGKKPDIEAIMNSIDALPLMSDKKAVFVDDINWSKMIDSDKKNFEKMLADIPDDCLLVVTAKAPAFEAKNSKKLLNIFEKYGCVVELGSRGSAGQNSFIKAEAKQYNCTISTDLCKYIISITESNMQSLKSEIAKICSYSGGGEITKAQIDAVSTPKSEARVFDLSKAIISGNVQRAMTILDTLFYLRESAVMVSTVLGRAFIDLYRARIARDEGKSSADVVSLFGYAGREFVVRNAFSESSNISANYIRRALGILCKCDKDLKSSPVDDRVIIEKAVVEIFALKQR